MSSPQDVVSFDHFDELLHAARGGDRDAQGRLLDACWHPLWHMARRDLRPSFRVKGSPSDVVQETFVRALRDFHTFQGDRPEQMLAWLYAILRHTAASIVRQFMTGKRELGRETAQLAAPREGELRRVECSACETAMQREQVSRVQDILSRMPPHYVEVLRLRWEERLSFEEIGLRTGRGADAARKLWHRAMREMARAWA